MNSYRINRLSHGLIMLLLAYTLCSCSYRLTRERQEAIKQQEHAFLHFVIREKQLLTNWYITAIINNETYVDDHFRSGDIYEVPIPVGNLVIKYQIRLSGQDAPHYQTGTSSLGIASERKLVFQVKANQHVYLKIVDVGNKFTGLGSCGTCIPWPIKYQEIALVIDRIEEGKPGEK